MFKLGLIMNKLKYCLLALNNQPF